ncbi:MAG: hypothetical protein ACXWH0_15955, partial [Acidimicrobiia bacterium]
PTWESCNSCASAWWEWADSVASSRTLAEHPDVNRLLLAGSRPDSAIALADELGMVFVDPASSRVANPRPPGDSRTALAAAIAAGRSAIEHRPVRLSEFD